LICNNKTNQYQTLCSGCECLFLHPLYCCVQCGTQLQNKQPVCGSCLISPPQFSHASFVCEYQPPVDKWVMALKFGGKIMFSKLFAELMQPLLKNLEKKYVLIPVPLHKNRLRKRGYNQAYEIAKELSKLTNRKLDNSLIRNKNTEMQAQLKFKQRAENVKNAFELKEELKHKYIILVDDVMTSGNTLKECAKTLIKAGAIDVHVLVFAKKSLC